MKKLLIQNASVIDQSSKYHNQKVDIYIEEGIIKSIGKNLNQACEIFNADSYYVSPGFIDIHVHCYHDETVIGISPHDIGVKTGVTTLIDAGTSGAHTVKDFYDRIIKPAKERVFVLLNTASDGLKTLSELSEDNAIDEAKIQQAVKDYSDLIVGLKARASSSVLKDKGIGPIIQSKEIAKRLDLPLVIHIGNAPPIVEEVLACTECRDVITHCYHNKPNGLFLNSGQPKLEVINAQDRGVKFDLGHGSSSFSFDIFSKALEHNFKHDFIGSDIYDKNINTVVKSLINVMNKVLANGYSLEDVIAMVTHKPADHFKLKGLGHIEEGFYGDFTIFKQHESMKTFEDSVGITKSSNNWIEAKYAIVNGNIYKTDNGGNNDVF